MLKLFRSSSLFQKSLLNFIQSLGHHSSQVLGAEQILLLSVFGRAASIGLDLIFGDVPVHVQRLRGDASRDQDICDLEHAFAVQRELGGGALGLLEVALESILRPILRGHLRHQAHDS